MCVNGTIDSFHNFCPEIWACHSCYELGNFTHTIETSTISHVKSDICNSAWFKKVHYHENENTINNMC